MSSSEDILNAAKEYTARGWVVHPLTKPDDKGNSPGKKPKLDEWQNLKETPENIGAFIKQGYNIGLVCGAASGVDALDIDNDIFQDELLSGVEIDTLISGHRRGRGHMLFKHDETMIGEKHHFIGIEYFGNTKTGGGGNLVLPPSIHHSGEPYKWKNPETPIATLPGKLKENLIALFKKEDTLHDYFKKCRHCFTKGSRKYDKTEDIRKKGLWDRPDDITVHGMDGRLAILAIMGELKAQGCTNELMHMACKRFFGKEYDYTLTENELSHIEPIHPKCETLRQYLNVECDGCSWKPTENGKEASEGSQYEELDLEGIKQRQIKENNRRLEVHLPVDHFVSLYVKWQSGLSDAYIDYHIADALWLLSAMTRGKVVLELKQERVKPNLWIFNIGKSTTSRKSTAVNQARRIYENATDIDLPNDDYSIEGYLESLSKFPITNNVRDEAAGLLAKFHKKYNEGIFDLECAMYDCQNYKKTLASAGKKEPRTYSIKNPYVTKLYATTGDNFARYMEITDFTCGYGFRFLYTYPKYKKVRKPLTLSDEEDINAWAEILTKIKKMDTFFKNMNETLKFKATDEAMQYHDSVCIELEKAADEQDNDIINSVIGRSEVHILKIAMVLELGKNQMNDTITLETMTEAAQMVTSYFVPCIMDLIDQLQEDIKINKIEKIRSVLRRLGGKAAHVAVLRNCNMTSKEFGECIDTMEESRAIDIVTEKNSKAKYYILLNHNKSFEISNVRKVSNGSKLVRVDTHPTNFTNLATDDTKSIDVPDQSGVVKLTNEQNELYELNEQNPPVVDIIVTEKPFSSLPEIQAFFEPYSRMANPDSLTDMGWRTRETILQLKTKLKMPQEQAERVWQDYCRLRNWPYQKVTA